MTDKVAIYQIYYEPAQLKYLDQAFKPFLNAVAVDEAYRWREFSVFFKAWQEKWHERQTHLGFLSWKFSQKAQVSGRDFDYWISQNPGYDVYSLNPFPVQPLVFRNVWQQAEHYHQGIKPLLHELLTSGTIPGDYERDVHGKPETLYCNYWVGNAKFWESFLQFADHVRAHMETRLNPELSSIAFERIDKTHNAPNTSFVMERLFTAFISSQSHMRHLQYEYSTAQLEQRYGRFVASRFQRLQEIKHREQTGSVLRSGQIRLRKAVLDQAYREVTPRMRATHRRLGSWRVLFARLRTGVFRFPRFRRKVS